LILNHNNIKKIENLQENPYLEHLDLSYNEIEVIENLDGLNLQKLNLMNNRIKLITGLDNLPNLIELNISKNQISRLKGLQSLVNLRYLYLSSNLISRAKQVAYISELTFLTDVDFCYNDVQNRKFYRFQVNRFKKLFFSFFNMIKISILDFVLFTPIEKLRWARCQSLGKS